MGNRTGMNNRRPLHLVAIPRDFIFEELLFSDMAGILKSPGIVTIAERGWRNGGILVFMRLMTSLKFLAGE